jgi:hypothetical protein
MIKDSFLSVRLNILNFNLIHLAELTVECFSIIKLFHSAWFSPSSLRPVLIIGTPDQAASVVVLSRRNIHYFRRWRFYLLKSGRHFEALYRQVAANNSGNSITRNFEPDSRSIAQHNRSRTGMIMQRKYEEITARLWVVRLPLVRCSPFLFWGFQPNWSETT